MILDEPTNHLDADSVVWLREFLKNYKGGLIVISHDVELVGETVNRVFYLDANRQVIDIYNMNWKNYLRQRVADEERRKKERVNVEKKATSCSCRPRASARRPRRPPPRTRWSPAPRRCSSGLDEVRQVERVAKLRFPKPAAVRQDAAHGVGPVEVVRVARDLHRCRPRDRPRVEGRRPRTQRRRQDDPAAHPRRRRQARHGPARTRPRPEDRLLRAGAREPRRIAIGAREHDVGARPTSTRPRRARCSARSCSPATTCSSPPVCSRAARRRGSSLATLVVSSANMLLLDEPTNNLDPASREEILGALAHYEGAVVLVSHDEGAVEALEPRARADPAGRRRRPLEPRLPGPDQRWPEAQRFAASRIESSSSMSRSARRAGVRSRGAGSTPRARSSASSRRCLRSVRIT